MMFRMPHRLKWWLIDYLPPILAVSFVSGCVAAIAIIVLIEFGAMGAKNSAIEVESRYWVWTRVYCHTETGTEFYTDTGGVLRTRTVFETICNMGASLVDSAVDPYPPDMQRQPHSDEWTSDRLDYFVTYTTDGEAKKQRVGRQDWLRLDPGNKMRVRVNGFGKVIEWQVDTK